MQNPWETGEVQTIGGHRIRSAWCDVRNRLNRVQEATPDKLRAMIAWHDTQKIVRLAAQRRLRKILEHQPCVLVYGSAFNLGPSHRHFPNVKTAKRWLVREAFPNDLATGGHVEDYTGTTIAGPWHKQR